MQSKHLFRVLFAVFLLITGCQEKTGFLSEPLFSKYENEKGVFVISLSPSMVQFLLDSQEDAALIEAINSFEKVKTFLYRDFYNENKAEKFYNRFHTYYLDNRFESLASIENSNERAQIFLLERFSRKNELVVLFSDKTSLVCIGCYGNIEQENLKTLMDPENIERLKKLKNRTI